MRVGRVLGCTVVLSPWLAVALAAYAAAGELGPALVAYALVAGHELAHLVVARGFGLQVDEVELWPFGGIARVPGLEAAEPALVALVALAGPLHHLLMLGVGELLNAAGLLHPVYGPWFLRANLTLGVINLLPALPLDGGRVLHAYLRAVRGEPAATRLALAAGYATAAGLAVVAVAAAAYGLWLPELAVLAATVLAGARREASRAPALALRPLWRRRQELARARVLPVTAVAAPADLPLRELLPHLPARRYLLVWVLDERLRPLGTLDEGLLHRALLQGRLADTVGQVLRDPPAG